MPRYETQIHTTAKRELESLDADARDRLTDTIIDVAETEEPTSHSAVRALEGQSGLFRVRVGDLRAICTLVKPELRVLKVGHRAHVYDVIDEIDSRRATA